MYKSDHHHKQLLQDFAFTGTVEPLIKDTPNKGYSRIHLYLHPKDTVCGPKIMYTYNTFVTSKKWTASLKRTKTWSQCVLYLEVSL